MVPITASLIAVLYLTTILLRYDYVRSKAHLVYSLLLIVPTPIMVAEWLARGRVFVYEPPFITAQSLGSFSFALDEVSLPIAVSISLVSGIIAYYSGGYMKKRIEELGYRDFKGAYAKYFLLYTFFSVSMLGVSLSTNLLEFYMFLEIALISSFLLIDYYGYGDRRRIAILYLVWTHVGAVTFLLGSLLYGFYAYSFDYINASKGVLAGWGEGFLPQGIILWAFALMLFGLLVKTAVFGLHLWLPYAHAEAPTPVSSLLSPLLIGLGPYAILRFLIPLFPSTASSASLVLVVLSLITIIYGGLTALWEDDIKRFLAYSSISQMGYLLLGASSMSVYGLAGLIIHYVAHAFSKAILFGSAGSIIFHSGERSIRRMGGLASSLPLTAGSSLIGFLGITGIPPALGFWGEVLILRGLVDYSFSSFKHPLILILLAFLGFSLTLAYSFRNYRRVFLGPGGVDLEKESEGIAYPLMLLSIMLVLLFIFAPMMAQGLESYLGGLLP